jgi:hypothetical protein
MEHLLSLSPQGVMEEVAKRFAHRSGEFSLTIGE